MRIVSPSLLIGLIFDVCFSANKQSDDSLPELRFPSVVQVVATRPHEATRQALGPLVQSTTLTKLRLRIAAKYTSRGKLCGSGRYVKCSSPSKRMSVIESLRNVFEWPKRMHNTYVSVEVFHPLGTTN